MHTFFYQHVISTIIASSLIDLRDGAFLFGNLRPNTKKKEKKQNETAA